jgi:hypothetical protein
MLLTVLAGVLAPERAVALAATASGVWHLLCVLETLCELVAVPGLALCVYRVYDGSEVRGSTAVFRQLAKSLGRFTQLALDLPSCDRGALSSAARSQRERRGRGAYNPFKGLPASDLKSDGEAVRGAPSPAMTARLVLVSARCLTGMANALAVASGSLTRSTSRGALGEATAAEAADAAAANEAQQRELRGLTDALWQPLLSTLATCLELVADEELMQTTLKTYQAFTQICGDLHLVQPRDAFLASLCSAALPHLQYPSSDMLVTPPVRCSFLLFPLFFCCSSIRLFAHRFFCLLQVRTMSNAEAMSVMERGEGNIDRYMHPLKTLLNIAHCLGNHLGSAWHLVLHALQQLASIMPRLAGSRRFQVGGGGAGGGGAGGDPTSSPSGQGQVGEIDIVADALERLFESTRYLDDGALFHVASALGGLALESIAEADLAGDESKRLAEKRASSGSRNSGVASFVRQQAMRGIGVRVDSGSGGGDAAGGSDADLAVSAEQRPPSFAFVKLVETAQHNIFRIALLWETVAQYLRLGARDRSERTRSFGLHALMDISPAALAFPATGLPAPPTGAVISTPPVDQRELLLPLQDYFTTGYSSTHVTALQSLLVILQTSGQYIDSAWPTVLAMVDDSIATVAPRSEGCADAEPRLPRRGEAQIVRLGFKCLDLITVSVLLCTVTFYANLAHSLTRSL